jgi:hypothetical protein
MRILKGKIEFKNKSTGEDVNANKEALQGKEPQATRVSVARG